MGLFEKLRIAPISGPATDLDADERLARRGLVLEVLHTTITSWAGEALTLGEAEWLLLALPELHAEEFKTMQPMAEA